MAAGRDEVASAAELLRFDDLQGSGGLAVASPRRTTQRLQVRAARARRNHPRPQTAGGARPSAPRRPDRGARTEILAAGAFLTSRSGRPMVTVQEVVDELRRTGSGCADSTIRTMKTSHMCAQVTGPGIGSFEDLDRVDRGLYRLR